MKRSLIPVLLLAAAWPTAAPAQDMGWSTIIPSVTGTDVLGLHLREQMRQQSDEADPEPADPAPDVETFRYTPSKARRAANLARFVSRTHAIDPGNAQDLERLFAEGDFIERIGGAIATHGLRVDNLADAYTVWWIAAWQASRGHNDDTSRATSEAVRAQATRALGATPQFLGAGDAARQEFAEALLIQAVLIDAMVDQSRGDAERLRQLAAAVNQGARGMGLDLTTMVLTEQGFVPSAGG